MTLNEMVATLRKLGAKDTEILMAKEAAKSLEVALTKTLSAGTSPEGEPWAPKKKDGGRPYEHAANRLTVKAYGNLVRATVTGPEVYGHYGVNHMPPRPMLPDAGGGIPKSVETALTEAATKVFEDLTK